MRIWELFLLRLNVSIGFRITGFLDCFHPQVKRWGGTYSNGTFRKTQSQSLNHLNYYLKQNTAINWAVSILRWKGRKHLLTTDKVILAFCKGSSWADTSPHFYLRTETDTVSEMCHVQNTRWSTKFKYPVVLNILYHHQYPLELKYWICLLVALILE